MNMSDCRRNELAKVHRATQPDFCPVATRRGTRAYIYCIYNNQPGSVTLEQCEEGSPNLPLQSMIGW